MRFAAGSVLVLIAALSAAAADDVRSLALEVEERDERSRLTVGGKLIRESTDRITPGRSGTDPLGRAAFATWIERGRRWFSYSRDAGDSWSVARPIDMALRLHAGATPPALAMPSASRNLDLTAAGRLHLVQFRTISLPEWRDTLEAAGGEVLAFFPHNAHIVRMPAGVAAAVGKLDFVERVEPYRAEYRLEPALLDWLASGGDPAEQLRLRVQGLEWGPAGKARILEAAEALGGRVAAYWPSGHVLELWLDRRQLRSIAAHDDVMWIDRWTPPENDMDLVREDAGTNWLESNFGICGQGVRGEVLDSGINDTHPDFNPVLLHGPRDIESHGTSTFGIVFSTGSNDAQATGHMPCADQGIFADYETLGDRFAHTQELKQAPYFASFQTNSWGSSRTTAYTSTSSQMDDIIWRLDILITQSQSNAGNRNSRPQAWAKNIVAVGGIRHQNTLNTSDDSWTNGASIGPAADGRIKPDLHYWYDSIYTTTSGGGYTNFCCTSASTPQVAGVIALMVKQWADDVWGTNPAGSSVFEKQPHASTIRALAINNAQQYTFSGALHDLTRVHQGWGRPSVQVAQERAATSFVVDEEVSLLVGQSVGYDVVVPAGETELKITMVYPDPPGTTSATLHRINDVNLEVTAPGGLVYHGNEGLNEGNYSVAGGSPNGVDTVENVFIQNPTAGTWTIEIEAAEVNQDADLDTPEIDVTFALVVTGATIAGQCGNGVLDYGEECDGADLGGADCADRGCAGGTLACLGDCTFDTSACSSCPSCGNGICEIGEDCLGCASDCISQSAVTCGNGICEAADGENCLTCESDCHGVQSGNPGNRYCCGDPSSGENPVPCNDDRCNGDGEICSDLPSLDYCCGDDVCEGAETDVSCELDCGVPTPGAARSLIVTDYNDTTKVMTLSFTPGCQGTDAVIEFGDLSPANLASYNWTGQVCGIGNSGSFQWGVAGEPGDLFFVVVPRDDAAEASYGTDSAGAERPEDVGTLCPLPQDLSDRCDVP